MNPFKLKWGKPQPAPAQPICRDVPAETVARLAGYAEHVLASLREKVDSSMGYDAAAVKWLSNDIDTARHVYSGEPKVRIANTYGPFLGMAILESYKVYAGRWVEADDSIGILFPAHNRIVFPITRVFKQIEDGEEFSMHSLFLAVPQFVTSGPHG